MPAVQFSNFENLHISFECKGNEQMNGKKMYAFLSPYIVKIAFLFFSLAIAWNLLCAF